MSGAFDIGDYDLEFAETDDQRSEGMSGVADASGRGMVFKASPGDAFWMKGCLVPLDLLFVDQSGSLISCATLRPPSAGDEPDRAECPPGTAAVIELAGGEASRKGLAPGDKVV